MNIYTRRGDTYPSYNPVFNIFLGGATASSIFFGGGRPNPPQKILKICFHDPPKKVDVPEPELQAIQFGAQMLENAVNSTYWSFAQAMGSSGAGPTPPPKNFEGFGNPEVPPMKPQMLPNYNNNTTRN